MSSPTLPSLDILSDAVSRLQGAYLREKQENQDLVKQIDKLKEDLYQTRKELDELKKSYKTLEDAHALTIDSPKRQQARRHIDSLINEIDKALAIVKQ